MQISTESKRTVRRSKRRYVVESDDSCPEMVPYCGKQLSLMKDALERAVSVLTIFKREMLAIQSVEAVAFLASHVPPAPVTLTLVVFMALERGNERHAEAFSAVTKAGAALSEHLAPELSSGIRFVNTAHRGLASQESRSRERWGKDSTVELLAFAEFPRR